MIIDTIHECIETGDFTKYKIELKTTKIDFEQLYNRLALIGNYELFLDLYENNLGIYHISFITFISACEGGNLDICELIYRHIPKSAIDLNIIQTAANSACMCNQLHVIKWIHSKQPTLDITNRCVKTAISNNNFEIFMYLVSIKQYLTNVIELFRECCKHGSIEIAKYLAKNYNIKLSQNRYIYIIDCINSDHIDIADYICNTSIKSDTYNNIICLAFSENNIKILKYILDKKPNIEFNIIDNKISINEYIIENISLEILEYLNTYYFSEFDKVDSCSICQTDNLESGIKLMCGHKYHNECIKEWININRSCPYCRVKF
jgi:hypothetical protein